MSDYKKLWENPANPELEVAIQSAEAANVCTAGTRELTLEELEEHLRKVEEYKALLKKQVDERRYIHSLNVADCAKELAELNGVDTGKAYLCGLLHDIEKNRPWDEQERYMEQLGDALPDHVIQNKKLWHAPAGAAFMRDELGILDADMIRAIKYHTTGRPNMSPLEKVLYVADYVSIERDYPGVERVREAAYRNLDEAILIGGRFTLISLLERYRKVNYDTFAMYNEVAELMGEQFEAAAAKEEAEARAKVAKVDAPH